MANPTQADWDNDGDGDACDVDLDNDGVPDAKDNCRTTPNWSQSDIDHDGFGDVCDLDDDNDGWNDVNDNCPNKYNPSQADGNFNGFGDACDPDTDGDGFYDYSNDNCTFVYNPSQADIDGDNLGDACDLCPNVADWDGSYTVMKWQSTTPVPYQPDSDDDGVPDACDTDAFGSAALDFNGAPYNPGQMFQPDGFVMFGTVAGPAGSRFRIPVPVCDPTSQPGPSQITEIVFNGLTPAVDVTLLDDDGLGLERLRPGPGELNPRGVRVTPDCARTYFLEFSLGPGFGGFDSFSVHTSLVSDSSPNPWATPGSSDPPPPPIADMDRDGLPDSIDSCPAVFDPTGTDTDADGVGDACDNCPLDFGACCAEICNGIDDNCDGIIDNGAAPGPVDVRLNPQPFPPGPELSWTAVPAAQSYDVVFADLGRLRNSGGDFALATQGCLADNVTETSLGLLPTPVPNQAFLILVRGNNCAGPGTYDSGAPSQVGSRDPGINAAPATCHP